MKAINNLRAVLVASTLVTLLLGAGCSDSDDANPSPGSNVIGGSKGDGGSAGSKAGNAGSSNGEGGNDPGVAGNGTGNTGNDGGAGPNPGGGGDGGGDSPVCNGEPLGEDGCFNCPETNVQYLNRCAEGDCVEFPHVLSKLKPDGSLPPLN